MNRKSLTLAVILCWSLVLPCRVVADPVTDWNIIALQAHAAFTPNSVVRTRVLAMVHAAVHDAVNAVDRRAEPYALDILAVPTASPEAAVVSAAYTVLVALIPSQQAMLDSAYAASLAALPDGSAKEEGVAVGVLAAGHILSLRQNDGSSAVVPYTPGTAPGEWRPTPPAFAPAGLPHWGQVTPFILSSGDQFRGRGPLDLTSAQYARDVEEVQLLGSADNSTRTADQTEIALFWVEGSVDGWSRIARTVSADAQLDLWENARLFALITLAMADTYIASFEEKYHYGFWRPVTAIREADTDGNPETVADPTWMSLVPTPPIPDYSSAHSSVGAAAAEAMRRFFGTDDVPFSTSSPTAGNAVRTFIGFKHAAEENAVSRIYVGFHFRHAIEDGLTMGRKIGAFVVQRSLRRVPDQQSAQGHWGRSERFRTTKQW